MSPAADAPTMLDLAQRLYDEDPSVRASAAAALGKHPDDTAACERLAGTLDDEDPRVREAVATALRSIFTARPDLVPTASADLHGEGRKAYFATVLRFVALLDMDKALDALFAARPVGDVKEWGRLVEGLADEGRFATDHLLGLAEQDSDGDHLVVIGEILVHRNVEAGYGVLLGALEPRALIDDLVARGPEGVRVLCRVGHDENGPMDTIVERLALHRKATERTIREVAATRTVAGGAPLALLTLGYWDDPENVNTLLAAARDLQCARDVRDAALEALCQLEAPEALDTLSEAMADPAVDEVTRWRCADALGEIGNVAALPALKAVSLAHPQGDMGSRARAAIRRIEE
jgi:hypothetical protein